MRLLIFTIVMLVTFQSFSQFVTFTIIWDNTDRPLLSVLKQKLAINFAIATAQQSIHNSLVDIEKSKRDTRRKEYEALPNYDGDLRFAVASNTVINNILLGIPLLPVTKFSFYNTFIKDAYFFQGLLLNNGIAAAFAIETAQKKKMRNANTQELYSLNVKMLTKLKKINKNMHKNAAFIIGASLLCGEVAMSSQDWELQTILEQGL
jgi:hypothetical protein